MTPLAFSPINSTKNTLNNLRCSWQEFRARRDQDQQELVGKESNSLEDVESGVIHSEEDVYTEYADSRRDEWTQKMLPALKRIRLHVLVEECRGRMSRRALIDLRAGRSRPHRRNWEFLAMVLRKLFSRPAAMH